MSAGLTCLLFIHYSHLILVSLQDVHQDQMYALLHKTGREVLRCRAAQVNTQQSLPTDSEGGEEEAVREREKRGQ